ncbi:MAG: histidine kinase, partial [Blastococcus sp.]|nr:histidine kinase [Blastococcus sp.]
TEASTLGQPVGVWPGGAEAAAGAEVLTTVGSSARITEEQAALRRVATLVAGGAAPERVLAVVSEEVGRLLDVDFTILSRYEPEDAQISVGAWSNLEDVDVPFPVGTRVRLGGRNVVSLVVQTGRSARIDDYDDASGEVAAAARGWRLRSAVGVPIDVEGRLWGVMAVASGQERPMPADTEDRLAAFTELVATAIANAQARVDLRSRAEEQAALRRVATMVARAAPPEEVFAAVTDEVGRVLSSEVTLLSRYDPDGAATVVGTWTRTGAVPPIAVGGRFQLGGRDLHTLVFRTRRPARIDDYSQASRVGVEMARTSGVRSGVGVPISVAGRLWGVIGVTSALEQALPADTETRLAGFTELVGTALANAQTRVELRNFAEEQAALRRVATLVARAAPAEEVFASVTAEVGRVLSVEFTVLSRYGRDGAATVLGAWTRTGAAFPVPMGFQMGLGGRNVHTLVFESHRPARVDHYGQDAGPAPAIVLAAGVRTSVGAPISVEGRLWGVMSVASTYESPLKADTESRLAAFTELVATAIANADAQAALAASRARIVAAADAARRRIERDLHDGVQQRLVSLALQIRAAQAAVPPAADELTALLDGLAADIDDVLDELREIARGLNPPALADGGLRPALKTLARRSAVPVRLDVGVDGRLPNPIELAAYYVIAEALTNAAKHAGASEVQVQVESGEGVLRVCVRDDGRGGADLTRGSGLVGLTDRVEAFGGHLTLESPLGAGTAVQVVLPLRPAGGPQAGEPAESAPPVARSAP